MKILVTGAGGMVGSHTLEIGGGGRSSWNIL